MKKLFLLLFIFSLGFFGTAQTKNKASKSNNKIETKHSLKSNKGTISHEDCREETALLRKKHAQFLKNSPFKKTLLMDEEERMQHGIPPNKYFESQWEATMNPETGRPTSENIEMVRKDLQRARNEALFANRTPGDAIDNSWVERGPTNVGGRTRAIMFDPNDVTKETVFAGGVSGGLWKNTNISNPASIWTRVNIPENLGISCIVFDPNSTTTFYVGTGESYTGDANGTGVWKSVNSGLTWVKVLGGISGPTFFQSASNITVNAPLSIAGNYVSSEANLGTGVLITAPFTSDIVLIDDGTATPTLGCSPTVNTAAIAGKVALIRRGTCTFIIKVKAAQDAGAIGVIIMNNVDGPPQGLGGNDPLITIPSFSISKADGNILEAAVLAGTVNVTFTPGTGIFTGTIVPGIQDINDIKIRNNAGVSEIYVAASDGSGFGAIKTLNEYGMYKSTNGGSTWTPIALPLTALGKKHCPNDIAIGSDNKIWVSTTADKAFREGGGIIFSSTDGVAFTKRYEIPSGRRTQIAVSSSNPNLIYVLAELTTTAAVTVLKTTDGFATTPTSAVMPTTIADAALDTDFTRGQAFYDLLLEVDPNNDQTVYIGGINLYKTIDGTSTWSQISDWRGSVLQEVHSDQHAMAFASSSKMIFGNDGGVYFSDDSSTTTTSRNEGFNVTQFYTVGTPNTQPVSNIIGDNFVAGAQDNGSQFFADAPVGVSGSAKVQSGDGAYSFFDQGADRYYITNYVYNQNINLRFMTGGTRNLNSETISRGAFICPMALDSKLDILFSDYTNGTTYQIRRFKNIKSGAINKATLASPVLTGPVSAMTTSKYGLPTDPTKLLLGTSNSRLLRVSNADNAALGSIVWENITGPGFVGTISDVEFGQSESEIFVTFSNYNVKSIWYSNDAGLTWQNKEGNFPDIPVRCILQNPLRPNEEVIIGTELGVWATTNFNTANPTWTQSYNGMSNVAVTDIDVRNDNAVYASTYGRGVFSGQFTATTLSNVAFENKIGVKVYPNPTTENLNISVEGYNGELTARIIDINGREVLNKNIKDFSIERAISLKGLTPGVYILNLKGEGLSDSRKIILN